MKNNDIIHLTKILVDSSEIENAINSLKWKSVSEEAKASYNQLLVYKEEIDTKLKVIESAVSKYHRSSLPVEISLEDLNDELVAEILSLEQVCATVREKVIAGEYVFEQTGIFNQVVLSLENNGSYLESIAFDGELKKLEDHPLKEKIEIINHQDYPFHEAAEYDESKWDLSKHCPNIKVLVLFGCELEPYQLERFGLDKMKHLQALELSENFLYELPECIFKLKNLKFLNLSDNEGFRPSDKERLRKKLPNTFIQF